MPPTDASYANNILALEPVAATLNLFPQETGHIDLALERRIAHIWVTPRRPRH